MKKNLKFFVIMTFVVFLIQFIITGIITSFITSSVVVLTILKTFCAWSSVFVLLLWFKRFYPGRTKKEVIKEMFCKKINPGLLFGLILLSIGLFLMSVLLISIYEGKPYQEYFSNSFSKILLLFFTNLIGGPLGEEPGWRGYYVTEKTKESGVMKASIFSGVLWGCWHIPMWFTFGYRPFEILLYGFSFLLGIISVSIIMGLVYHRNHNLIYSITLHQGMNFLVGAIYLGARMEIIASTAIFYFIAAVAFIIYYKVRYGD